MPGEDTQAASPARSARPGGQAGQAGDAAPTTTAGLPASARLKSERAAALAKIVTPGHTAAEHVAAMNKLGIPSDGSAPDWAPLYLADKRGPYGIGSPTTTDLGAGNPRNGVSPW